MGGGRGGGGGAVPSAEKKARLSLTGSLCLEYSPSGGVASPSGGSLTASNSATSGSVVIAYHQSGPIRRSSSVTPPPLKRAMDNFKETGEVPKSPAEIVSGGQLLAWVREGWRWRTRGVGGGRRTL